MKISSFNCGGFRSNFEYVKLLMSNVDLIFIQESLLYDQSNDILSELNENFNFDYVSASRGDSLVGRCSGGLVTYRRR